MNRNTLIGLGIAALIAIVAAVVVSRRHAPRSDVAAGEALLAPGLRDHVNEVSKVVVTGAGDHVLATLERGAQGWTLAQKGGYAVDSGKLRELLLELADAKLVEEKTSTPGKYAALGVNDVTDADAKGVLVTLEGLAQPLSVIIGDTNPRGGSYVRRAGEARSWLASTSLAVDKDPLHWLRRDLVSLPASRIASVTVTHPDGKVVRIAKQEAGDANFSLLDVPKGREPGDAFALNSIAGVLDGLTLDDVFAAKDAPAPAGALKARFTTSDGVIVDLTGWDRDGRHLAAISASLDEAVADHGIEAAQARVKAEYDKAVADAAANKEGDKAGDAPIKPLAVTDAGKDRDNRLAALQGEVAAINARLGGWTFVLPAYKYANLDKPQADLLKPVAAPAAAGKTTPAKR